MCLHWRASHHQHKREHSNPLHSLEWGAACLVLFQAGYVRPSLLCWETTGISFLIFCASSRYFRPDREPPTIRKIILTLVLGGVATKVMASLQLCASQWIQLPINETHSSVKTAEGCLLGSILCVVRLAQCRADNGGNNSCGENVQLSFTSDLDMANSRGYQRHGRHTTVERLSSSGTSS